MLSLVRHDKHVSVGYLSTASKGLYHERRSSSWIRLSSPSLASISFQQSPPCQHLGHSNDGAARGLFVLVH